MGHGPHGPHANEGPVHNGFHNIIIFWHLMSICFYVQQIGTEPSDNQYLVMDIGLAALPSVMIGNNGPHSTLIKQKPTRHLLSFLPLFSVISFLLFQTLCYVGVWFYVQSQNWYLYCYYYYFFILIFLCIAIIYKCHLLYFNTL